MLWRAPSRLYFSCSCFCYYFMVHCFFLVYHFTLACFAHIIERLKFHSCWQWRWWWRASWALCLSEWVEFSCVALQLPRCWWSARWRRRNLYRTIQRNTISAGEVKNKVSQGSARAHKSRKLLCPSRCHCHPPARSHTQPHATSNGASARLIRMQVQKH